MQRLKILSNPVIQNVCKTFFRSTHLEYSPNSKLSKEIWNRYKNLPTANCKVQVTYIWIDGTGENLLSKTKTMEYTPVTAKDCPNWVFNGAVTNFTQPNNPDVILCPVAVYNDPVTQGSNKLVLCETYHEDGKPTKTNHRQKCMVNLNSACSSEPQFGFEQMFQFMDFSDKPFGWPLMSGEPSTCKTYYCSVGADRAFGREIIECVYKACLHCGINLEAAHPEITPSQWELHFGASPGIKAGDDIWITRYLLKRIAEDFGVIVTLKNKQFCITHPPKIHTSFSTKEMRDDGGLKCIEEALKKLEKTHAEHMNSYVIGGAKGDCGSFTSGTGGPRNVSCRIPKNVANDKKGYFVDKRPPANADPYQIMSALLTTLCIKK